MGSNPFDGGRRTRTDFHDARISDDQSSEGSQAGIDRSHAGGQPTGSAVSGPSSEIVRARSLSCLARRGSLALVATTGNSGRR